MLHPALCCGEHAMYGCNVHAACTRHGEASGTWLKRCAMSMLAPARAVYDPGNASDGKPYCSAYNLYVEIDVEP